MFETSPGDLAEIVARVTIVYAALLVMMRVSGRRTMSDVTPMDIMLLLLVSETVSPSLTAGDESLTAGLAAAATLVALSMGLSALVYRSRAAEKLVSGDTATLVRDGRVDDTVRQRYRITREDLDMALHREGLERVDDVRRAFVEADGEITIVKKPGAGR